MSYKVSSNSNFPLVSVLIPLYNAEKYIKETLRSVVGQTYKNIEVIIVDDGSTDNSLSIVRKYEKKYNYIHVFTHENKGASATRNVAFDLSQGDYIQYLDADDILEKSKIENQINLLEISSPNSIAIGKCGRFINNINQAEYLNLYVNKDYVDSLELLSDMWINSEVIYLHAYLVPRSIINKAGQWNEALSNNDDGEFFCRVLLNTQHVYYVDTSILYYRLDSLGSLSKTRSRKSYESNLLSLDTCFYELQKFFHNEQIKYALCVLYSNYIYYTYPKHIDLIKRAEKRIEILGYKKPFFHKNRKLYYLSKVIGFYNSIKIFNYLNQIKKSR